MPQESAYFIIENVDDKHDLKDVKRGLDQMHGVHSVSVSLDSHLVAIDYDSSGVSYDLIAVSYTHLDVYKRQPQTLFPDLHTAPLIARVVPVFHPKQ